MSNNHNNIHTLKSHWHGGKMGIYIDSYNLSTNISIMAHENYTVHNFISKRSIHDP